MNNIMIIVPHEDDEILMTAGIIESAVRSNKRVTVVLATNGDYEGSDQISGSVRLPESLAGLRILGLSEENVIFMGYADTGMDNSLSFLHGLFYETDPEKIHPGHCSLETYGMIEKPDFHTEKYGAYAPYTRRNFKEDLREIILSIRPDAIFTTSAEDVHGDHSGLFLFVKEILAEEAKEGYQPELFSGLVHSKAGDENWPLRNKKLEEFTCPDQIHMGLLKWEERISFLVPDDMQENDLTKNRKAIALSQHKNALKDDAVEFLYSFVKADEVFWKITEMEKSYGI